MVDSEIARDAHERLHQELRYLARLSTNRFIDFAVRAGSMALDRDEIAAMNCQTLSDLNSNDAIQQAYEAGQMTPIGKSSEETETQGKYLDLAGRLMDDAQGIAFDAAAWFHDRNNEKGHEFLAASRTLANQALETAVKAGTLQNEAKRDGLIPTLTLDPSDPHDL